MLYYIYRHRRKDTGEIFYVGVGSTKKSSVYKRAYEKFGRNRFWNNIINKADYVVEIVYQTSIKKEALELETFMIEEYGRKCYNEGILVNISSGGEGAFGVKQSKEIRRWRSKKWIGDKNPMFGVKGKNNHRYKIARSEDTKAAISRANKGKVLSNEHKSKLSKAKKGKYLKGDNPSAKMVIDTETGEKYASLIEACESTNFKYNTLKAMLQGRNPNKTNLRYYE